MKIAIIGAGNMGGAIARGMAQGSIVPAENIIVSNPSQGKLEQLKAEFPSLQTTHSNQEAVTGADMIILAVKPWLLFEVLRPLTLSKNAIIASVAAGITCDDILSELQEPERPVVHIIPNTAISELQSMTLMSEKNLSEEQRKLATALFDEMGTTLWVPESKMAAATSLASCGIAYALKYIQSAMQAGIEMGIYPHDAMKMVAQSVKGAAELILNKDTHPSVEIDKVCTPGGLTIKGVNTLDHEGFASAIIKAMKASQC